MSILTKVFGGDKKKPVINCSTQYRIEKSGVGISTVKSQDVVFSNGEIVRISS